MESFSQKVKKELCAKDASRECCAGAELYGMLLFCGAFSGRGIRVSTASRPFAERFCSLFEACGYGLAEIVSQGGGRSLILIENRDVLARVFEAYGYDPKRQVSLHLNGWVIERECCRTAFLRGAFLSGGFVTDPEKQFRLEIITPHSALAREFSALLVDLMLDPKTTRRQGNNVLYYKESDSISKLLGLIGAPESAALIATASRIKGVRNMVNRRVNCEASNIFRTVETGQSQIDNINFLIKSHLFDELSDPLKAAAELRLENPDLSLSELTELAKPQISRSGLNRRLQKINEFAEKNRDIFN